MNKLNSNKTKTMKISIRKSIAVIATVIATQFCDTAKSQTLCNPNYTWMQTTANVITFTNTTTGGLIPYYHWDFGDGNTINVTSPVHTFNIPGTYTVCLTMYDSLCGTNSYCGTVTVTGTIICNMTAHITTTTASCSSCADGSATMTTTNGTAPLTYVWMPNVGTGSTVTGLLPGGYYCCVTDVNNCHVCTSDTVHFSTCQANFSMTNTGSTYTFVSNSTGTNSATTYHWNFGDGNIGTGMNATHTYTTGGLHTVCLIIADSAASCYSQYCHTITVNIPCSAMFTLYPDSLLPHTYWAHNQASGNGAITCSWNWGDGNISTGMYPTHTYASSGNYTICLTITDATSCTNTYCNTFALLRTAGSSSPITVSVIGATSGIRELISNSDATIYPNPASDKIEISYTLREKSSVGITLLDVLGKSVIETKEEVKMAGENAGSMNTSELKSGVYFLTIKTKDSFITRKVTLLK